MKATTRSDGNAASANITKRIQDLADWRGETLARVRQLIHDADPDIEEEWKWAKPASPGTPVWSHDGIVCTGESYKQSGEAHFRPRRRAQRPEKAFQFEPRRKCAACYRHPRRQKNQRTRVPAAHPHRRSGQFRSPRSTRRKKDEEVGRAFTHIREVSTPLFTGEDRTRLEAQKKREEASGSLPFDSFNPYCSATRPDCEQGVAGKPNAAACELTRTTPVSSIQYAAVPDVN